MILNKRDRNLAYDLATEYAASVAGQERDSIGSFHPEVYAVFGPDGEKYVDTFLGRIKENKLIKYVKRGMIVAGVGLSLACFGDSFINNRPAGIEAEAEQAKAKYESLEALERNFSGMTDRLSDLGVVVNTNLDNVSRSLKTRADSLDSLESVKNSRAERQEKKTKGMFGMLGGNLLALAGWLVSKYANDYSIRKGRKRLMDLSNDQGISSILD